MRHWTGLGMVVAAFSLSSCGVGGGDDFNVDIRRNPAAVYGAIAGVDTTIAGAAFPGLKVNRTKPAEGQLLLTVPDSGSGEATFLFEVEEAAEGASRINVTIHVPAVKVTVGGKPKVISERRVELAARKILQSGASDLEAGSAGTRLARDLSLLVAAVAIASNPKYVEMIESGKMDTDLLEAALRDSLIGEDESRIDDSGDRPMEDPDRAAQRAQVEHMRSTHMEDRQASAAAAPMDQGGGDSAEGIDPRPDDSF